jgi:hypothetical protein
VQESQRGEKSADKVSQRKNKFGRYIRRGWFFLFSFPIWEHTIMDTETVVLVKVKYIILTRLMMTEVISRNNSIIVAALQIGTRHNTTHREEVISSDLSDAMQCALICQLCFTASHGWISILMDDHVLPFLSSKNNTSCCQTINTLLVEINSCNEYGS